MPPDTLRLHNTLSGRVDTIIPLQAGRISFYSCGPTVYDFAHIGNFRSFLAADLLRRWLESPLCARVTPDGQPEGGAAAGGYDVTHVMNITDVGHMVDDDAADGGGEDKMEAARKRLLEDKKSGTLPPGASETLDPDDPYDIAAFYADAFMDDARLLGLKVASEAEADPSLMPRPTRMIPQMLELVLALIHQDHAYVAADGVAYFATESYPGYGELSGNTLDKLRSGAGGRVSETTQAVKRHPADFMLWKPDPTHLMRWDPPTELARAGNTVGAESARQLGLGEGYPGWHLECSVMARERLGDVIDIHSGGEDNIFPHHECERAQSCCGYGHDVLARSWFHPRFLQVEGEKMSKSAGNFFTVRDLVAKGFAPPAIRLELIKTHYRSNANFTEQGLKDAHRMVERWRDFLARAETSSKAGEHDADVAGRFAAAMNDDLNIAGALGVVNAWIGSTPNPTRADAELMRTFDDVIGVLGLEQASSDAGDSEEDARIDDLVRQRDAARKAKDWGASDRIRDELAAMGIAVEDTPEGGKWSRKAEL